MTWCVVLPVVLVVITQRLCFAIEPQVAELSFDGSFRKNPTGTNSIPAWIQAVEQEGGEFLDHPPCWHVAESNPPGRGRLSVVIDRHLMNEDLAMSLLCDEGAGADLAAQLFDVQNRVLALDLFTDLIAVGKEVKTDTYIIPWRKYPGATRIVIRRIQGEVTVHGMLLYPVVSEIEGDDKTQQELARLLGDPLSPESPLVKHLQRMAQKKGSSTESRGSVSVSNPSHAQGVSKSAANTASIQRWNAFADFSTRVNPTGVWSYGYATRPGHDFHLYTKTRTVGPIGPGLAGEGDFAWTTGKLLPVTEWRPDFRLLGTHPYNEVYAHVDNGLYNVVRWTAPVSGRYAISGVFKVFPGDMDPPTSDASVFSNGERIFHREVNSSSPQYSFQTNLTLVAGNTLDFATGDGGNGMVCDTTGFDATIETLDAR
jgi:hypothetical protein